MLLGLGLRYHGLGFGKSYRIALNPKYEFEVGSPGPFCLPGAFV